MNPTDHRHRRRLLALAIVTAGLAGAACSSDGDSSSTSTGATTSDSTAESTAGSTAGSTGDSTPDTGGDGGDGDGYSVAAWLQQIPVDVVDAGRSTDETVATAGTTATSAGDGAEDGGREPIFITTADLDRATELAGATRPDPGSLDRDAVLDWMSPLTGLVRDGEAPVVAVQLPQVIQPTRLAQVEEFQQELGWSVVDVDAYIEYANPPHNLAVLSGAFDEKALTAAMGAPEDGIFRIGDEDYGTALTEATAARPIGEAVRIALDDGLLADARATPLIESWLGRDEAETLADDEVLADLAAALDAQDVYAAILEESASGFAADLPPQATLPPEEGLGPFVAVGVGLAVDDGEPIAVFSYRYADEASATAAVARFTDLIETGVSFRDRLPWSDRFSIRDVAADGDVMTGVLELKDFRPAGVWQILYGRDSIVTSS